MQTCSDVQARFLLETALSNPYIPHKPTQKQAEFLLDPHREVLFGGAAGGGKSDALLMAALQFVERPDYAALILRRTHTDLALPGALVDRSLEWLSETDAHWDGGGKTWTFPSGSTITFGYLERRNDHYRYQSSEYQYIGLDELTQFLELQYRYMFSRLRRLAGASTPLRMRTASNPGGLGHDWVKRRFLDSDETERHFIPAKIQDNPYLDQESYIESLSYLDPTTREQLLRGDWTARHPGSMFRRDWFVVLDEMPKISTYRPVRFWDTAATEDSLGKDPDWTCGVKVARAHEGGFYVQDVRRRRLDPAGVEDLLRSTAESDGRGVKIRMWQEPGSSGKLLIDAYRRGVFLGYDFDGIRETGPKHVRASIWAGQAGHGNVYLVAGTWVDAFLDEVEAFSDDESTYAHDDQVDATSGAMIDLMGSGRSRGPLRRRQEKDKIEEMRDPRFRRQKPAGFYG